MTLRVSVDPESEWIGQLDEGLGLMKLIPCDQTADETNFPSRETSLYAGRAIVDSSNSHIIGYILVRSDISELQKFLEESLSFSSQRYGFYSLDGDLLFGDLPADRAAAVLENADITTDDIRSQSSEITLSADGGSMQYHYTIVNNDCIFLLETPLTPPDRPHRPAPPAIPKTVMIRRFL